ncbi:flagellar hook-length control protein FliK [Vibrio sp. SS-MA-C1-2]|uniref:flagellar hook-length control protein FliK n=1 Tax=Vibrio sp. SS-MA-C1-2 TaxID=2908646 RepID=UPI001F22BDAD|nr:flagellar hook-length control protein FliK [Vibrio sp. SS-MA-C1-2]UJF18037.1 flagellar hook-length control protein FliK [Vibrio sp. SS-MA-C1-2]
MSLSLNINHSSQFSNKLASSEGSITEQSTTGWAVREQDSLITNGAETNFKSLFSAISDTESEKLTESLSLDSAPVDLVSVDLASLDLALVDLDTALSGLSDDQLKDLTEELVSFLSQYLSENSSDESNPNSQLNQLALMVNQQVLDNIGSGENITINQLISTVINPFTVNDVNANEVSRSQDYLNTQQLVSNFKQYLQRQQSPISINNVTGHINANSSLNVDKGNQQHVDVNKTQLASFISQMKAAKGHLSQNGSGLNLASLNSSNINTAGLSRSSNNDPNGLLLPSLGQTSAEFVAKVGVSSNSTSGDIANKLHSILADKLTFQVQSKTPVATIRLDPPELGKLDLMVKLDGDKLSIQITSNNSAVREAIQQTSERLRNELVNQNFLNVDVSVNQESGSRESSSFSQQSHDDETIISDNNSQVNNQLDENTDFLVRV